jgi:hypothetical protein
MIARSRLSPTKEVTGGKRATMAQEAQRPLVLRREAD